jgi:hypothetical protein
MFFASKWDHRLGSDLIGWVVIKGAGVEALHGDVQILGPRSDVAYFLDTETAEEDAKSFARAKNTAAGIAVDTVALVDEVERKIRESQSK